MFSFRWESHIFLFTSLYTLRYFAYILCMYIYIYIITNNINDYSLGYSFFNWTINKIVYIVRLFLPPLLLFLLSGRPFSFLPRFDSFFLFSISFFRFQSLCQYEPLDLDKLLYFIVTRYFLFYLSLPLFHSYSQSLHSLSPALSFNCCSRNGDR